MFRFWRRRRATAPRQALTCGESCPLAGCPEGSRAIVVCLACPLNEANRLRALGVFEGAGVSVVHARNGILLDIRGSRIAVDRTIAASITVRPEPA